jgi:hypothetical protein
MGLSATKSLDLQLRIPVRIQRARCSEAVRGRRSSPWPSAAQTVACAKTPEGGPLAEFGHAEQIRMFIPPGKRELERQQVDRSRRTRRGDPVNPGRGPVGARRHLANRMVTRAFSSSSVTRSNPRATGPREIPSPGHIADPGPPGDRRPRGDRGRELGRSRFKCEWRRRHQWACGGRRPAPPLAPLTVLSLGPRPAGMPILGQMISWRLYRPTTTRSIGQTRACQPRKARHLDGDCFPQPSDVAPRLRSSRRPNGEQPRLPNYTPCLAGRYCVNAIFSKYRA